MGKHQLKGLDSQQQLYQLLHPDLPIKEFPPLKTMNAVRHNLPMPATSFIGREREVAEIKEMLAKPDTRLLTMLGPGGTGKTRLSQHVAAEVSDEFKDGVWFVELENITSATNVPQPILTALNVRPQP